MNRPSHKIFSQAVIIYQIWAVAVLVTFASCKVDASEIPFSNADKGDVLVIGVRESDDPFSYKSASRSNTPIMQGYSGYMVEICRRVITELVKDSYFDGYRVITEPVTAKERFSLLDTYSVDLLCGPDSITEERLESYNASHPVFLSGVALVSRPAKDFPRTKHCEGIVGMVDGTTSAQAGLEKMAELDDIRRFKSAIVSFLAQHGWNVAKKDRYSFNFHIANWLDSDGNMGVPSTDAISGYSPVESSNVITSECQNGFNSGPIVFYKNHDIGINAFCAGKTLFYLGDIDLLKSKFDSLPTCEKVFHRTTLTREAYGIYFRKASSEYNEELAQHDAMLYARFNNILLRKMQDSESILDHEYKQQFGEQRKGSDLIRFFDSFKYANQY